MANLKVERQHSFLEYVFGGCEIDLSIAIDFTLSNGDPNRPGSLHTRNVKQNQYLQAIRSVGDILQFYNQSKMINLYGFGGAVPPYSNRASHCFAMNGDIFNPQVNGIDEVIAHYSKAINNVNLYGPTYFGEVLNEVNNHCESIQVDAMN